MPFLYPRDVLLKIVYLSFAGISCSLGSSSALACNGWHQYALKQVFSTHQSIALHPARCNGLYDIVHEL